MFIIFYGQDIYCAQARFYFSR